ncbi:Hypothetical predicted protein [Podarcis lilfordi]|uniref:C-type lectin domain-containing protein n=2 Tax=Podarcis lilfordi TaxID=74358 RepID=A0AA35PIF8_9SAUR|nr:Hypothetical predicted protein [Podarcis lilfordi]
MGPGASFHLPLLSFLVISFLQATSAGSSCPTGWMFFEKSCYGLFNQVPLKFTEAEKQCQSSGGNGHLASIMNGQEMSVVAAYVKDLYKAGKPVWIGLHSYDLPKSKAWKWTDSSVVSYHNWAPGQPSQASGDELCVELMAGDYLTWKAAPCTGKHPFLCRAPLEKKG